MKHRVLWLFSIALIGGFAQSRVDDYAVILDGPPLADQVASRKTMREFRAQTQLQRIESAQRDVRRELERRHIRVVAASQTLLNAVFVRGTAEEMEQVRHLPGVARVAYLPPMRHHMDRAINLVRAPAAWDALGGIANAGAGVKVAIIDSGIDHKHPAFQDESLPPPSNPPAAPESSQPYTNNKIIVARSYVDLLPNTDSDYTPRDHMGFGTAIAMIAAGVTNKGPSTTITGVAPKAYLGNYKVFGTPGDNENTVAVAVIKALEDALRDGMDIAALAFGSGAVYPPLVQDPVCAGSTQLGLAIPSDACDVRAQALERAVRMGMTVVISAGNDGAAGLRTPTLNTINTPGTAPSAITVGATLNAFSSVRVSGDDVGDTLRQIDALFGDGPRPAEPVTAPLRDVARLGDNGRACGSLRSGSLSGAIALIQRGDCPFADKVNTAARAGAVGVIIYQRENVNTIFHPLGLADSNTPAVMISYSAGLALKNFIASRPDRAVTLDPSVPPADAGLDRIAWFSSRGPSIGDAATLPDEVQPAVKPEVVAPGSLLYAATEKLDENGSWYDPSGYTFVEGTSFAVPLAAGVAALVKQANPGWSPQQIKSAVVNTASPEVSDDDGPARVTAIGAGKLNAAAAVATKVTAEPATISFGLIGDTDLPRSRTIRITNAGVEAAAFTFSAEQRDADANAQVTFEPDTLQLNPGDSGTVAVRLSGGKPEPGSYEGVIKVANLRIPYLYLVSDAEPASIFPVAGNGFKGKISEANWQMVLKLTDRYGVPLRGVPVTWRVARGGGRIDCADPQKRCADAATDRLGIASAIFTLGPQAGAQQFTAEAGGLIVEFNGEAVR